MFKVNCWRMSKIGIFSRAILKAMFAVSAILVSITANAQSPPTVSKAFSAASIGVNSSVTLTFTITNPNPATDLTNVSLNDNLPAGLIIANPDSLVLDPVLGSCDPTGTTGVITPQVNSINLIGGQIPANATCTFSVDVLAISSGTQVNTTDPISSTEGGTGGTATASVDVVFPDLTVAMSHTGSFFRPQTGANYTITVSNSGGADTSALITVDFNLPAGITASALGGPNWNCALAPLRCTRGDTLFAGTSFEDITLTVNVAGSAPASFAVSATVSGGGETNTANDTATDQTQTVAALVLGAQTANISVSAGGTASTTLNITLNDPGAGTVTFACSGLPALAACTFNPTSIAASGPVTVNITTTAKSTTLPTRGPGNLPPMTLLLLFIGAGSAALLLAQLRVGRRRLRLAGALACLALLAAAGCGVGPPAQHNPGTPTGTSAVVVTATATGGATAKTTVNLTVQ